ncbi:hypothetical protein DM02DRAFT_728122 [Periconia macrospinosa]|uniref:P-loop containing nucleoside triphosphate hydrolase protein n=1 Tax=Periconia macrospinosa TaxID=97972 RepID=A0A2V1DWF1_9PLEO|nr:hypothetical protein DM02DRAFT_728122 [Periconia macrospinosa]
MVEPASALEGTTLHQLLSNDDNQLLDAIDELRSLGIGRLLEGKGLPQIIVCGDQSSGKSSVLEALTRVHFPTKSSTCTTFPTELRLRREQQSRISCRIKAGPTVDAETAERLSEFSQSFDAPEKFADLVAGARKAMSRNSDEKPEFFDHVLEVEIMGPKLVPLTLVDLPGVIHYSNAPSGSQDIELINDLVGKYMAEPNSIILAVVSAHNDLSLQAILTRIQKVNGATDRTLGIITKPDELPRGSEKEQECIEYARSNTPKFKYGWHVVRNRSFAEQSKSLEERDALEKDFFKKSSWDALPIRDVGRGIDSLRQKLSKMLINHISLSLPSIVERLERDLTQSTQDLHKLGDARTTVKEMRNYLFDISDSFGEYTRDALEGRYHRKDFFGGPLEPDGLEKRLRANVRSLNDAFATKMLQQGHKWHVIENYDVKLVRGIAHPNIILKSDFLKRHVDVLAHRETGIELPGMSNPILVGSLFQQQSEPWERIASEHLEAVWNSVKTFLETLLYHLTNDRTSRLLFSHIIDPALEKRRQELKTKLEELLTPHRNHHPLSIDPKFARTIWALREKRVARSVVEVIHDDLDSEGEVPPVEEVLARMSARDPPTENKYGSLETYEVMEAHYESAILTFMNNVASLAIEQCLLSGVAKMLSSATIRDMEDDELQAIAAESDETMQERARLSDRVKTLEKGLGILRFHPASRMQRATPKPATLTGKSPLSAEAQATQKPSIAVHNPPTPAKRRAESVLSTVRTPTTSEQPFFTFSNHQTTPSTKTNTVAPSGPPQRASTPATQPTTPAPNPFGSRGTSSFSNTSNAPSPGTGGLFGQATLAKPASSTNSSNSPSVVASGSPFSTPANPSNLFGNSATSHPSSGAFGSPSANNTGGTSSTQAFGGFGGSTARLFGNTPKGT